MPRVKKYSVNKVSQALLVEALQTLPLTTGYSKLSFLAKGLSYPVRGTGKEDYAVACEKLKITPYSSVSFSNVDGVWDSNQSADQDRHHPDQIINEPLPHSIKYSGDFDLSVVNGLIRRGYQISSGKIFIADDDQPDRMRTQLIQLLRGGESFFPDARLNFDSKNFYLMLEPNRRIGLTRKLLTWYDSMKKKYEPKES